MDDGLGSERKTTCHEFVTNTNNLYKVRKTEKSTKFEAKESQGGISQERKLQSPYARKADLQGFLY
jgi:hypothetical protein